MKLHRAKTSRKLMSAYTTSFAFRPPYQVLLTSSFILAAASCRMNLGHLLQNTLQSEIKPMITQCCIRHLYDIEVKEGDVDGKLMKEGVIAVAKEAERRRCGHHELDEPLAELECILFILDPKNTGTNRHKYIVCTQDRAFRSRLRSIPGVPLVYINRSVMILEPMAEASETFREKEERGKMRAGLLGGRGVKRQREEGDEGGEGQKDDEKIEDRVVKRRKGPKAPNPLSVKKSKAPEKSAKAEANGDAEDGFAVRKSAKKEARNGHSADGATAIQDDGGNVQDGERVKRKRKRKPKGSDAVDTPALITATAVEASA
ncbi:hypothetical protein B0A48_18094 [Cryoendolithus antarcticus]|uniref:U three protein 23 n=1 Tax=Cryoendolithus antarcticus TaxID=1507870 RepID=A0A1V8S9U1_9PEZI|nr:hypothetical protein B0A48_18094 [Cryoendolithus antarcticus]